MSNTTINPPDTSPSSSAGWLEVSTVTGALAALPAFAGATIYGLAVEQPLVERVSPELLAFQSTLATRLQLTAPLTVGIAIIAALWISHTPRDTGPRMIVSGLALLFTTWLGKVLALGLAVDLATSSGAADIFSGNPFTRVIGLLIRYFELYGAVQFTFAVVCGVLLGWHWTHRARRLLRGY